MLSTATESQSFDQELVDLLQDVARLAKAYRAPIRAVPLNFKETLKHLSLEQVAAMKTCLRFVRDTTLRACGPNGELPSEQTLLKSALESLGLEPMSDDLYSTLEREDIVEVHDLSGTQIYRNFEAFNLISFTLFDLIANPWYTLYSRPQLASEAIQRRMLELMSNPKGVEDAKIPDHLITELEVEMPRSILLSFKKVAPLRSKATGEIAAFFSTKSARLIAHGEETSKIAFI